MSISTDVCSPGYPTELTVSYPFYLDIPFFGQRSMILSSSAVMRCSG
jgi:hypothetical protein